MQESGKQSSLPPPPEEVGSKRKGRRQDDVPNSLRQMLELKVQPGPSFSGHSATHMLVCMEVLRLRAWALASQTSFRLQLST